MLFCGSTTLLSKYSKTTVESQEKLQLPCVVIAKFNCSFGPKLQKLQLTTAALGGTSSPSAAPQNLDILRSFGLLYFFQLQKLQFIQQLDKLGQNATSTQISCTTIYCVYHAKRSRAIGNQGGKEQSAAHSTPHPRCQLCGGRGPERQGFGGSIRCRESPPPGPKGGPPLTLLPSTSF